MKKLARADRSLLLGAASLAIISALYPWSGNSLALTLFGGPVKPRGALSNAFGIALWMLGAWLVKSIFNRILRRTIFPNDGQPHARRLFADLASGLVYVVAFVGIMETVLREPISTMLATSGVLAVVLGLALQNTLADVFSGLAINIERPFGAGDWITLANDVEGQVIEINWRATRIRTFANDTVAVPNSVVAKATVTNHRQFKEPHLCSVEVAIDHSSAVSKVIGVLEMAAQNARIISGSKPIAYASTVVDSLIVYRLTFGISDFSQAAIIRSGVIGAVVASLAESGIALGELGTHVRLVDGTMKTIAPAWSDK